MAPISPTDTTFFPRREFIRDQRPASAFSILALSGAALLRLYSFPTDTVVALRKHLESINVVLSSRELPHDNFHELALEGKPWSSPKSMRSEKLLIEIIDVIHLTGHKFLTTMDYGREQDDRIIMAFSRTFPSPLSNPAPTPPFHSMSNDSLTVVTHPAKLLFAISFISQSHLRVIAPPLHLTPAILQTVRGSWPRGVVSEKKAAENVYEFKLKGYKWFQEDTFATDSLRHILSLLGTLDGFGFTLLTSLSLNNRSRSKDLWVFTGVSQPNPSESQASSFHGSRTDLHAASFEKARERRRSSQGQAHPATVNSRPSHARAATEHSLAHLSHNPPPSSISSKSVIVRKPAPRAQLPVSVAQSTASNDHVHDGGVPSSHSVPSELRMELQSDVGSAEDMTGVGTQKYGRAGEPEKSLYQQASRFYSMTPGTANPYYPNMSTSVMNTMQPSGPPQGLQTTGRTETPTPKRAATTSSLPLRSRTTAKAASQPATPLLGPGAFRDSDLGSNMGQTADISSTWPGAGRGNGHSIGIHGDDHVLPGGWIPTSVEAREIKALGDHPNESNVHDPALRSPEEQEVKAGIPELVRPRRRLARSGKATLVPEVHRADIHGMDDTDRHYPPMRPTPDRRETDPPKSPDGWVLVSVGQPSMTGAPQAPTSRPSLRRKHSFPPTRLQKPQHSGNPHSTGVRGATTDPPDGRGHRKTPSNPNPSSMSPAAKAIVIIDAMQAKRKTTSGDGSQSSFRKFFSFSRPESPKSPSKEGRPALSGGGAKGKMVEREDSVRRREGTWRMRGTPEARSGNPD